MQVHRGSRGPCTHAWLGDMSSPPKTYRNPRCTAAWCELRGAGLPPHPTPMFSCVVPVDSLWRQHIAHSMETAYCTHYNYIDTSSCMGNWAAPARGYDLHPALPARRVHEDVVVAPHLVSLAVVVFCKEDVLQLKDRFSQREAKKREQVLTATKQHDIAVLLQPACPHLGARSKSMF